MLFKVLTQAEVDETGLNIVSRFKVYSIGCFIDGELVSVTQFSFPIDKELSTRYTAVLLNHVVFNNEVSTLSEAVVFYVSKFNASDLFSHLEFKGGCRVSNGWEWFKTDITFYTYKVTASDSNKYYFGVSHVKSPSASFNDCLNDGYYGSGSKQSRNNKFSNWKVKHLSKLEKTVLETFSVKAEAYEAEGKLVGNLWKTDTNCLNSVPGGFIVPNNRARFEVRECEVHGDSIHAGESCKKCVASNAITLKHCGIHGEALHMGSACKKCVSMKSFSGMVCEVHGETMFQGNSCLKCSSSKGFSIQDCSVHGSVSFHGDNCVKCTVGSVFSDDYCPVHGLGVFRAGVCERCSANSRITRKYCDVHGVSIHQGDSCAKCSSPEPVVKFCETHGETLHVGETCLSCRAGNAYSVQECSIHGLVTFTGSKCKVCSVNAVVQVSHCEFHGLVKFQGSKCSTCSSMRTAHARYHSVKTNPKCFLCPGFTPVKVLSE